MSSRISLFPKIFPVKGETVHVSRPCHRSAELSLPERQRFLLQVLRAGRGHDTYNNIPRAFERLAPMAGGLQKVTNDGRWEGEERDRVKQSSGAFYQRGKAPSACPFHASPGRTPATPCRRDQTTSTQTRPPPPRAPRTGRPSGSRLSSTGVAAGAGILAPRGRTWRGRNVVRKRNKCARWY